MITFRTTKKVASRLRQPSIDSVAPASNLLGDWYVNIHIIRRQHVLMLVSERTLLPVLIPAKDLQSFPSRFLPALGSILVSLSISQTKIETELRHMEKWQFAKTVSRQVLGSMNDFAHMLDAHFESNESLEKLAIELAESPCSPINMASPLEATRALFGSSSFGLR